MNKTLWRLQNTVERLWLLANMMAQQAAALDIRGLAVVAEETRNVANKLQSIVEKALFDEDDIKSSDIRDLAIMLNLLALNSAIECSRLGFRGKPAVVCVEDIRILAYELAVLFDENDEPMRYEGLIPYPKTSMTSVEHRNEFLLLSIAGVIVVEQLTNVREICMCKEHTYTHIKLRGMEIPLIDGYRILGKLQENPMYVIVQTPWAEQNKTYAVAADVKCLFFSPTGIPVTTLPEEPLARYSREYWESENDIPFLFIDWPKLFSQESTKQNLHN